MTVLLGRTSASTTTDFNGASHCAVWKFTASASGQLATIFGQTKVANAGATSVDLAVYSDDAANARPLNRLGTVTTTTGVTGTGVFSGTLGATVTIVASTVYWLGWRGVGEQWDWQGDAAGSYLEATGTGVFPDPWPAGAGSGSVNAIIWGEDSGGAVATAGFMPHRMPLGV